MVQRALVTVLNCIYEVDFLGFSYGFRPGRSQHDALDALFVGIMKRKVNWVFDADIRGYFDAISHEWLVKLIEHRIADRRVVRLIQKWLSAGVLEDGEWRSSEVGTPQGGGISPLLANVYLHYVFDLWVRDWRRQAKGDVIVVRFADDIIVGFQHEWEARRFWNELRERFAAFGLELHPEKTRLLEFGPFAAANRKRNGRGKPETSTSSASRTSAGRRGMGASWSCGAQRKRIEPSCGRSKMCFGGAGTTLPPRWGIGWLRSSVGTSTTTQCP